MSEEKRLSPKTIQHARDVMSAAVRATDKQMVDFLFTIIIKPIAIAFLLGFLVAMLYCTVTR